VDKLDSLRGTGWNTKPAANALVSVDAIQTFDFVNGPHLAAFSRADAAQNTLFCVDLRVEMRIDYAFETRTGSLQLIVTTTATIADIPLTFHYVSGQMDQSRVLSLPKEFVSLLLRDDPIGHRMILKKAGLIPD
jgi:hypothetical protein